MRIILWITSPSLIKGMALGVALALIGSLTLRLNALWYIASALMMIGVALLVGAVVGNYIYESQKRKLVDQSGDYLRNAGAALTHISDDVVAAIVKKDRSHLANIRYQLERLGPIAQRVSQLTIAFVFRAMAMSTLFAVLGGVVSFAVFLAAYMQVERMTEQNELIKKQNEKLAEQTGLIKAQNKKIDQEVAERKRANDIRIAISLAEQRRKPMIDLLGEIAPEVTDAAIPIDLVGAREKACGNHRIELSPRIYRRIRTTLPYLAPYRSIDLSSLDLTKELRSPEQEELLHYLYDANVDLGGSGAFRFDIPKAALAGFDFSTSRPNLRGAKFRAADLRAADLHCAALAGADLEGANLRGATLAGVDLSGANLKGADLTLARLKGARGLTPEQVKRAQFWWLAVYDAKLAGQLGISEDARKNLSTHAASLPRLREGGDEFDGYVEKLQEAAPAPPTVD